MARIEAQPQPTTEIFTSEAFAFTYILPAQIDAHDPTKSTPEKSFLFDFPAGALRLTRENQPFVNNLCTRIGIQTPTSASELSTVVQTLITHNNFENDVLNFLLPQNTQKSEQLLNLAEAPNNPEGCCEVTLTKKINASGQSEQLATPRKIHIHESLDAGATAQEVQADKKKTIGNKRVLLLLDALQYKPAQNLTAKLLEKHALFKEFITPNGVDHGKILQRYNILLEQRQKAKKLVEQQITSVRIEPLTAQQKDAATKYKEAKPIAITGVKTVLDTALNVIALDKTLTPDQKAERRKMIILRLAWSPDVRNLTEEERIKAIASDQQLLADVQASVVTQKMTKEQITEGIVLMRGITYTDAERQALQQKRQTLSQQCISLQVTQLRPGTSFEINMDGQTAVFTNAELVILLAERISSLVKNETPDILAETLARDGLVTISNPRSDTSPWIMLNRFRLPSEPVVRSLQDFEAAVEANVIDPTSQVLQEYIAMSPDSLPASEGELHGVLQLVKNADGSITLQDDSCPVHEEQITQEFQQWDVQNAQEQQQYLEDASQQPIEQPQEYVEIPQQIGAPPTLQKSSPDTSELQQIITPPTDSSSRQTNEQNQPEHTHAATRHADHPLISESPRRAVDHEFPETETPHPVLFGILREGGISIRDVQQPVTFNASEQGIDGSIVVSSRQPEPPLTAALVPTENGVSSTIPNGVIIIDNPRAARFTIPTAAPLEVSVAGKRITFAQGNLVGESAPDVTSAQAVMTYESPSGRRSEDINQPVTTNPQEIPVTSADSIPAVRLQYTSEPTDTNVVTSIPHGTRVTSNAETTVTIATGRPESSLTEPAHVAESNPVPPTVVLPKRFNLSLERASIVPLMASIRAIQQSHPLRSRKILSPDNSSINPSNDTPPSTNPSKPSSLTAPETQRDTDPNRSFTDSDQASATNQNVASTETEQDITIGVNLSAATRQVAEATIQETIAQELGASTTEAHNQTHATERDGQSSVYQQRRNEEGIETVQVLTQDGERRSGFQVSTNQPATVQNSRQGYTEPVDAAEMPAQAGITVSPERLSPTQSQPIAQTNIQADNIAINIPKSTNRTKAQGEVAQAAVKRAHNGNALNTEDFTDAISTWQLKLQEKLLKELKKEKMIQYVQKQKANQSAMVR